MVYDLKRTINVLGGQKLTAASENRNTAFDFNLTKASFVTACSMRGIEWRCADIPIHGTQPTSLHSNVQNTRLGSRRLLAAIYKYARALESIGWPGTAPLHSEFQEDHYRSGNDSRETEQSRGVAAGEVFQHAKDGWQEESSEPTSRAHDSGNKFNFSWEALRRNLKHSSISHAKHAHGKKQ